MTIKDDIQKIEDDIKSLNSLKRFIQEKCPHENLEGEFKANTGNWDRSDDSYWVSLYCKDCRKYWSEDQRDIRYNISIQTYTTKDGFRFKKI